jgi:hypothetical protein
MIGGGAKLQSLIRLKLSLSLLLRQWSREYTILKFRTKKRKKEFLFQNSSFLKSLFGCSQREMSLHSFLPVQQVDC